MSGTDNGENFGELPPPTVQINDSVFGTDYMEKLNIYADNPDTSSYYIFDVDTKDSYREIGIYFDGPSGDPETYLLRYEEGQLRNLGSFLVRPMQGEERLIVVPGDGTIEGRGRLDLVETNWGERTWKLEKDLAGGEKLAEQVREVYEIEQWDRGDMTVITAQNMQMYSDKSEDAELVTIPAGEKVAFRRYYSEEGWLQMAYGNVESLPDEDSRNTAEASGEVRYAYFRYDRDSRMINTAAGERNPFDVFKNLSMVD